VNAVTSHATLTEWAPDLYVHDGAKRFLGFRIQRCMTIVRLAGGSLFVHSPNTLDDALRQAVSRLGEVEFIVAPNAMHAHAVDQFSAAWPRAVVCADPGLRRRHPDLRIDRDLGEFPEAEWHDDLDQATVDGNVFFREVVFLHRASRTLIVTDLIENLHAEHLSPFGRLTCRLFGVYGHPTASPEHSLYTVDPDAAETSLSKIGALDFDRITLAHGRRIERDGKRVFDTVARELVSRVRRRGPARRWFFAWMARWQ
jgi:hypothetical protein